MSDRDYKAFIVEGEFREPQVIDNISKKFFNHGNCKLIPLPAGENIYMLWKKLKADDFETDIIEVLRESSKEIRKLLMGLSRDDFNPSEIFALEEKEAEQQRVYVLSAFPEFLVDYFGMKLWKTSVKHTKNQLDKRNCK